MLQNEYVTLLNCWNFKIQLIFT